MCNFSNSNSHLELVPDYRLVEVNSVPLAKEYNLSLSNSCDISSLTSAVVKVFLSGHIFYKANKHKMIYAHLSVSYTLLSEDELLYYAGAHSPPPHPPSFFVDFKGLVLGLLKMCFNVLPLFSTFWCLLYDWSLRCSCRKYGLDSILDGTQHTQGLDFSLYYLFICDFCWKISNCVCHIQDFDIYGLGLYFPFACVSFYEVTNEHSIKALWLKHFSFSAKEWLLGINNYGE